MTRTIRASRRIFLDWHRGGRVLGLQMALALCGGTAPCAAQEDALAEPAQATSPEVLVDCTELDPEARAAIEARQMSELLSQDVSKGTLRLVCSADRVTGTWEEDGMVLDSRFLSRNQGEGAVELVHWLASVLLEMRREREAGGPLGEETRPRTATTTAVGAAGASAAAAPDSTSAVASDAASNDAASSASTNEERPQTAQPSTRSESKAPAKAPELMTLDASWVYSHFGTEVPGTTGPRLGLRLRLAERFQVGVLVDGKVAILPSGGPSVGFGLVDVTAGLSASYDFLPFLSATLAPILVLSNFMGPSETSSPGGPFPAAGALLFVRGKVPWRDAHPFVELGVQAATPARQATLNGTPTLTVPEWQAQVAVGVEVPL